MRYFSTLFSLFLACSAAFAQTDTKAKEILDKAAAKFKTYPAVEIDFNFAMENKAENINENHKGKAFMKKNMYKLELMDVVNYYDGQNIYTYMAEVKEVNIKNPNEEEEEMLNPATLFEIHNKGFKHKLISTDGNTAYIELYPTDLKKNFQKIGVWVNTANSMIQKVTSFGKDGNNIVITINNIKQPATIPADLFFKFDSSKYPGVEVIDLR